MKSKAKAVKEGLEGIEELFKKAVDEAYERGKQVGVGEFIDQLEQGAIFITREGGVIRYSDRLDDNED